MSLLIIEVFLCIGFILLFYQCCVKGSRRAQQREDVYNRDHPAENEDLRRFRERMSERATQGGENNNTSTVAARKELIEKNLFSRQIHREESVKELAQLLAISRGGTVDEELGECNNDGGTHAELTTPAPSDQDVKPTITTSESESSMPAPSAPPSPAVETTDNIATAIYSAPTAAEPQSTSGGDNPTRNTITFEPIRNLWTNLTHNIQTNSERDATATTNPTSPISCQTNVCTTTHLHKLECSVCLENYSPNDIIAWAKDGGDPPTLSSLSSVAINNDMGCDHIFHRECLVAWLQDHDECPLCRRKVVHADADVRFSGWEMR